FDQIRFFPVAANELMEIRDAFPHGQYSLRIEQQQFRLREYHEFLTSIAGSAASFIHRQQEAFFAERERWALEPAFESRESEPSLPEGCRAVRSPTTASVWKVAVAPGQRVAAGENLVVREARNIEIAVAGQGHRPGKPSDLVIAVRHVSEAEQIGNATSAIAERLRRGGKLIIFGNGG
ncbi:hypothetical protein B4Q13_23710, partial [Lacticaseibacillus rhamnosus]